MLEVDDELHLLETVKNRCLWNAPCLSEQKVHSCLDGQTGTDSPAHTGLDGSVNLVTAHATIMLHEHRTQLLQALA
jgi:hypothetical protein